jgi:LPXTG-site transpeptidase (sortase) family protein
VYWFDGGFLPGEDGNAVIAGHVNRPDLSPAPFWNLHLVKKGDKIIVQPLNGPTLTFVVTSVTWISAYAKGANNTTLGAVFGPASTRNLNLLTCIGDWDGHTFDHRLFVQSELSGPDPFTQP